MGQRLLVWVPPLYESQPEKPDMPGRIDTFVRLI